MESPAFFGKTKKLCLPLVIPLVIVDFLLCYWTFFAAAVADSGPTTRPTAERHGSVRHPGPG